MAKNVNCAKRRRCRRKKEKLKKLMRNFAHSLLGLAEVICFNFGM